MDKKEFGEFIRQHRLELVPHITLREFARKIGISPTYLSRIERGEFDPPSEEIICNIAKELKVNKDELLALAGKISSDLTDIIIKYHELIPTWVRMQARILESHKLT